jgi:hypothetical protein
MEFSRRGTFDPTPNALSQALERARARGAVLDLTVSNPTAAGIPYARERILAALADPAALTYQPAPFGLPQAQKTVAGALGAAGLPTDPDRIMLTASTSEAYSFLFKLLCDPGDEVLIPRPSYPLLDILASFENVRLVPYPLVYEGRWRIDLEALRGAVGSRTRAILAIHPNNPTGSYLKRPELEALSALGLPIISDEVFADYPLRPDPDRAAGVLQNPGVLGFALGGLSKLAALPQLKLSWIAVGGDPTRVAEALSRLEWLGDNYLSVGTPVQLALPELLACRTIAQAAIRERTRANLELLRARVAAAPVLSVLDAEGGWYAILRLPRVIGEEAWTLELLDRHAVYVHPGHFFDFAEEAYLVLSLLTEPAVFSEGVQRILKCVEAQAG